jgi:tripartite-type tricarboxylate transporter receptor subunit TctC
LRGRISTWAIALIMASAATFAAEAPADTSFPSKPITIVVPLAAGSTADGAARTLGNELSIIAKQPVIIDNRPGASGVTAAAYAAKAPPDGYTIFLATNSTHAANVSLFRNLPYDPVKDFTPITMAENAPAFFIVRADSPISSMPELIETARQKPGVLNVGVFSVSGIVAATMLSSKAGINFLQVPYKTPSSAINDLLGGRLDALAADVQNAVTLTQGSRARALAVTSARRFPIMPDVPAISELGVPDYEMVSWGAYFAPAGTPREIVAELNRIIHIAYATRSVRETSERFGMQIRLSTPEELGVFVRSEISKWSTMIKASGLEPQ